MEHDFTKIDNDFITSLEIDQAKYEEFTAKYVTKVNTELVKAGGIEVVLTDFLMLPPMVSNKNDLYEMMEETKESTEIGQHSKEQIDKSIDFLVSKNILIESSTEGNDVSYKINPLHLKLLGTGYGVLMKYFFDGTMNFDKAHPFEMKMPDGEVKQGFICKTWQEYAKQINLEAMKL